MQVLEATNERVDGRLHLGGDGLLGIRELGRRDDQTALAQVGAVEPHREVEQGIVALGAHARDDLAHGLLHGGVDLEAPDSSRSLPVRRSRSSST